MYTFDENIDRIEQAKSDIKAAIEEKGVYVGDGNINTYANKVRMIKERGKMQKPNITITENNTTTSVVPDDGYVGLEKVVVKTEIPIGSKSVEYNRNGNYTITPDDEYEGYDNINVNVDVKEVVKLPSAITFNGGKVIGDFDMGQWDWSNIEDWSSMFRYQGNLTSVINFPTYVKPTNMSGMFSSCSKLETLNGVENWDTSNVVDMSQMFYYCSKLRTLDGIENWDMSKVTNMGAMFSTCSNLTSIDVSKWDTSNVTAMNSMFSDCSNLRILNGIENWDVSKVTNMNGMFSSCRLFTSIDLSKWDMSNVTNMAAMFGYCFELKELKMGGDVSKLTNVSGMFSSITTTGTFYYDSNYDYSKIIAVLPKNWTAVPME